MRSLSFDPSIPASLWAALCALAIGLMCWYALRRPLVMSRTRWTLAISLMSLSIALLLAILLNPTWVQELPPPAGKPLLTVLVDATGSMATPDAGDAQTRYQAACKVAAKLNELLDERFDVRLRLFSDAASNTDLKQLTTLPPTGQLTDLATAIASSLDPDRAQGQAVALLSDGIDNASGSAAILAAARLARAVGAPIYTRTFGTEVGGTDLAVDLRPPQDLAFIGQRVPITARVSHLGINGGHADVSLLLDGREVERQKVDLAAEGPVDARFWVKLDKTGVYAYEVRVDPVPGEVTQINNSAAYLLRVVNQPVRVLLLEGKPYWDTKFLIRTLGSVPAVELDSCVQITQGRLILRTLQRGTPEGTTQPTDAKTEKWKIVDNAAALLADAAALKRYQVIVIGRDADPFLTETGIGNLQQWITRDGGSMVCYRGSPVLAVNDRLAKLLPVRWSPAHESRFHLKMTDQGRDMHWLVDGTTAGAGMAGDAMASLPMLATEEQVDHAKPLATVLATTIAPDGGRPAPAVVYQPYGTGRVVVIQGAGMWRWAFLPPQYQQNDQVYASLWHSLLRWLVSGGNLLPGQTMTLRADKVSFAASEPATASLIVREEKVLEKLPVIELISDSTKQLTRFTTSAAGEAPGAYRVNFGKLPDGRYQARVAGAAETDSGVRTLFDVRSIGPEQLNLQARPDLMARIASDSGGTVLTNDPAGELTRSFGEHMARLHPPRYERTTAWDRWWVLALVFGIWTAAWAVRRSGGLV